MKFEIENAKNLGENTREKITEEIIKISSIPGSSLLTRKKEEILGDFNQGIVLVALVDGVPAFTVAFEEAAENWREVGLVVNLTAGRIKGRDFFSGIIEHYVRENPEKILYLTTTDIRMKSVAEGAGFGILPKTELLPLWVGNFCCTPCPKRKTGSPVAWIYCRRRWGVYTPKENNNFTEGNPCWILLRE